MKKPCIVTLLILIIASATLFAVSDTDNFTVTTTIAEIGKVKVSAAAIGGNTLAAYTTAGDLASYGISSSGNQTNFTAYLTTLSNERTGYKVSMSATAMKSGTGASAAYINYTVGCNSKSLTTSGASAVTVSEVMNVTSLTTLTGASEALSLSIDATTFNAAVSGEYVGTVTFNFVSNA